MKQYIIEIILAILFLLYANTSMYWLDLLPQGWEEILFVVYIITLFAIIALIIFNIVQSAKAKLKDWKCNFIIVLMVGILTLSFMFPRGLIPKSMVYDGILLTAYMDGVAGNIGWLTLYGNNKYEYNYGRYHVKGKYIVQSDTIYFSNSDDLNNYEFDYATFWKDGSHLEFGKDSIAFTYLEVVTNELYKNYNLR